MHISVLISVEVKVNTWMRALYTKLEQWRLRGYASPTGFMKSGFLFFFWRSAECQPSLSLLISPTPFQPVTLIYSRHPNLSSKQRDLTVDQWEERNPATSQHLAWHDSLCVCVWSVGLISRDLLSHQWAQLADAVCP